MNGKETVNNSEDWISEFAEMIEAIELQQLNEQMEIIVEEISEL